MVTGEEGGSRQASAIGFLNPVYLTLVPDAVRQNVTALWGLDRRLGELSRVRSGSEPMLARIRLQYWREELPKQNPATRDPVLAAIAAMAPPPDDAALIALVDAWDGLVAAEVFDAAAANRFAEARGEALFGLSAVAMGAGNFSDVLALGAIWALCDLGLHCSDQAVARHCLAEASKRWRAPRAATTPRALVALAAVSAMVAKNDAARRPLRERALVLRVGLTGR